MINELFKITQCIERLNKALGVVLVNKDEVNEARENINEYQEDLEKLKVSLQEIESSKLEREQLLEFTLAKINIHLGDMIQDLQNIDELIKVAARRYVEYQEKIDKTS